MHRGAGEWERENIEMRLAAGRRRKCVSWEMFLNYNNNKISTCTTQRVESII